MEYVRIYELYKKLYVAPKNIPKSIPNPKYTPIPPLISADSIHITMMRIEETKNFELETIFTHLFDEFSYFLYKNPIIAEPINVAPSKTEGTYPE